MVTSPSGRSWSVSCLSTAGPCSSSTYASKVSLISSLWSLVALGPRLGSPSSQPGAPPVWWPRPSGGGLGPDGRDERQGRGGHLPVPRVAQHDLPLAQRLARREPGERRVHGSPGREAPDAGLAEPGRHQPLKRQVVIGAVDDLRRDPPPLPGLLELELRAPPVGPGDHLPPVQHV